MILYSKNKEDVSTYIKEYRWHRLKGAIIVASIVSVFNLWCLVWGLVYQDDETINKGVYEVIIFSLLAWAFIIYCCIKIKKNFIYEFNRNAISGEIQYELTYNEELYVIKNLNRNLILDFKKSEIKKVHFLKHIIIVDLKTGVSILFPRISEIEHLFEEYKIKK